jgi:hypothetical protein
MPRHTEGFIDMERVRDVSEIVFRASSRAPGGSREAIRAGAAIWDNITIMYLRALEVLPVLALPPATTDDVAAPEPDAEGLFDFAAD